ncbi:unnamed protein product, partial [marine sediment metagenome]
MGYHGKPDWGLQLKKTVYTFDDLSELAVRLGSEVFFDRRGDVYLIENFENGLAKWEIDGSGSGWDCVLTSEKASAGGYSVKLTGGKTSGYESSITKYFPYPVLSKWGFETHFGCGKDMDQIYFTLSLQTGTHQKAATILYDRLNKLLQYKDLEGIYRNIKTSYTIREYGHQFNVLKIVADLENLKYTRLIINEDVFDLSNYDLFSTSDTTDEYMWVRPEFFSKSGVNG